MCKLFITILKIKNNSLLANLKLFIYIYHLIKVMEYSQGFNLANNNFETFSIRLHEINEADIKITFVFPYKTISIYRKRKWWN